MKNILWLILMTLLYVNACYAKVTVTMKLLNDEKTATEIGTVTASDTKYGLLIRPNLTNLPNGIHGFHIHEVPSCKNAGMAAGGHLDPAHTNLHLGPYNAKGHIGDLPFLYVDANGLANLPILAPRLTVEKIRKHALMIHVGGDNYSDTPPMGGGGARLACGVINGTPKENANEQG